MALAWIASLRSEARSVIADGTEVPRRIGCCVLGKDNRILSMGYNGFIPGFVPPPNFYQDPVKRASHIIHAETNALINVKRGEAGLIACTLSPCATCAQQIIAREIPIVIYGEGYKNTEGLDILNFFGTEIIFLPLSKVMEEEIIPGIEDYLSRH
jgi:dCMP deaminase